MPNSLKCKLSSLRYKRLFTDEEYQELIKKLGGHDREIRNKAIDELMNALCDHCMQQTNECYKLECPFCTDGCDIINIAEQLKGEKQ